MKVNKNIIWKYMFLLPVLLRDYSSSFDLSAVAKISGKLN